jgi:hypothetical protein
VSGLDHAIQATEDHHSAVGAFLKFAEAAITRLRYTRYLHDRDVGKAPKPW